MHRVKLFIRYAASLRFCTYQNIHSRRSYMTSMFGPFVQGDFRLFLKNSLLILRCRLSSHLFSCSCLVSFSTRRWQVTLFARYQDHVTLSETWCNRRLSDSQLNDGIRDAFQSICWYRPHFGLQKERCLLFSVSVSLLYKKMEKNNYFPISEQWQCFRLEFSLTIYEK